MMNQVVILGRLAYVGKDFITLVASKNKKESDGTYGSFSFNVYCSPAIIENVREYNMLNDLIAVKGYLDGELYESNNKTYRQLKLYADKLSSLSSSKATRGEEIIDDSEEF